MTELHPATEALTILDELLGENPDARMLRVATPTLQRLRALLAPLDVAGTITDAKLTKTEIAIYSELRANAGLIVSMERLMGISGIERRATLWVHMRRLREKMARVGSEESIRTVNGVGYVYQAEVADV